MNEIVATVCAIAGVVVGVAVIARRALKARAPTTMEGLRREVSIARAIHERAQTRTPR